MTRPVSFRAEAWNPVPESENRIHSDDVARAYGFRGALVPGVTVSAYLLHPAAVAWGRDFVERGQAHVVVHSPVYDGERFRVEVEDATDACYAARLFDPRGAHCASAEVTLPPELPAAPRRRGAPVIPRDDSRPTASREVMETFRKHGLGALEARWNEGAEITRYLRDPQAMAPVYQEPGPANPSFVLGLSNWSLGGNVKMSPWLHLETHSQHFRAIEPGTRLTVEAAIADLFQKKGHEFVDVDLAIYAEAEREAAASVRLRAIYRLRSLQA
jgi:hypothetical protein